MEIIETDVAIVGAGGARLPTAVARVSKVHSMLSHTCAAEVGAAGVIMPASC